jgi:hypothetical protein
MNAIDSTAPQSSEPNKVENGSCADETLLRRPRMPQEVVSNTSEPIIWPDGKTTQIPYSIPVVPCGRLGEAFVHEQRQIALEVKGQALVLPIVPEIIVGRKCSTPQDTVPGVDLSTFDAFQQGVSRLHVRLSRAHDLIYVTDLDSLNGTFLNGHRLIANQDRLLRSGDELQLGFLTIRVSFNRTYATAKGGGRRAILSG